VITSRYWELGDNKAGMKVAAYQAPLKATFSIEILTLIREQISWCELNGVEILCCPEAVLGGLADYESWNKDFAINAENGELETRLAVLASHKVTTILGWQTIHREFGQSNMEEPRLCQR
jgi:hypothetical protein